MSLNDDGGGETNVFYVEWSKMEMIMDVFTDLNHSFFKSLTINNNGFYNENKSF